MKRTSIKEVAKRAGVSITTVSRALNGYSDVNEETRQKIRKIASDMNYAPNINARALGGMPEPTIGLVLSDLQEQDNSSMVFGVISGVYHACIENGCDFVLLAIEAARQTEESFVQLCRKKNLDAVVVMGLRTDDIYVEELEKGEFPCALIDMCKTGKNLCCVSIDNVQAAYEAVHFMLEKGHQHIGMINGEKAAAVSRERYTGYAKAVLEAEKILDPQYVKYSNFNQQKAFHDTVCLLKEYPEISALFCASDEMAISAIQAVESIGKKVPQDISIVGFDDIPAARYIQGGMTTVRQEPYRLGYLAGEAVYKMICKEPVAQHILAPYELMVRRTCIKYGQNY